MRAYESISLHMHAHAALALFYKRLFFFQFLFLILLFSKTNFNYTIYHLFDPIKIPLSCLIGVHFLGGKSPDDTIHLTQPHSMGWRVGGLSNAISDYPNEVSEFCGVSLRSLKKQNNFKLLIVI